MRFGKKVKLSHRFIGPFEILRRVGKVAYELALPPGFSAVTVQLDKDLTYEEEPVAIIDRLVCKCEHHISEDVSHLRSEGLGGDLRNCEAQDRNYNKNMPHLRTSVRFCDDSRPGHSSHLRSNVRICEFAFANP
uniref:Tf2-1-like SH3-like domain-containing protein n=1 Tax=Nicotiana tabacum TaxID=4097 RepID=A0A1S4CUU7_TOBAC|nr:PREDICTED: uncharacterized protein LOC107822928 [Nicotiana tabacum]